MKLAIFALLIVGVLADGCCITSDTTPGLGSLLGPYTTDERYYRFWIKQKEPPSSPWAILMYVYYDEGKCSCKCNQSNNYTITNEAFYNSSKLRINITFTNSSGTFKEFSLMTNWDVFDGSLFELSNNVVLFVGCLYDPMYTFPFIMTFVIFPMYLLIWCVLGNCMVGNAAFCNVIMCILTTLQVVIPWVMACTDRCTSFRHLFNWFIAFVITPFGIVLLIGCFVGLKAFIEDMFTVKPIEPEYHPSENNYVIRESIPSPSDYGGQGV